jgi:hypothetical protein
MPEDTIPSPAPEETIAALLSGLRDATSAGEAKLFARAVARHFEHELAKMGDDMSAFVDALTTSA